MTDHANAFSRRDGFFRDFGTVAAPPLAAGEAPDRYRWDIVPMDAG